MFLAGIFVAFGARGATVHFSDFQSEVSDEWSQFGVSSAPNPDYVESRGEPRNFLGQFGNNTVTLDLNGLPPHDSIHLSFELFTIRSWDGTDTSVVNGDALGPDVWSVSMDGRTIFEETFSNGNPAGQSYDGAFSAPASGCSPYSGDFSPNHAPMTGASECYSLGYTFDDQSEGDPEDGAEAMDSVYSLVLDEAHSGDSLTLAFGAEGLQGLSDESWGLDNVRVETSVVPLPGALGLFGAGVAGFVGLAGRRRRKAGADGVNA